MTTDELDAYERSAEADERELREAVRRQIARDLHGPVSAEVRLLWVRVRRQLRAFGVGVAVSIFTALPTAILVLSVVAGLWWSAALSAVVLLVVAWIYGTVLVSVENIAAQHHDGR